MITDEDNIPFPTITLCPPKGRFYSEGNLFRFILNRFKFNCNGNVECSKLDIRTKLQSFFNAFDPKELIPNQYRGDL